MPGPSDPRDILVELCRQFYAHGWVSGTGGGISLREQGRIYMAPSGVQKERLRPDDLYVLDEEGELLDAPADPSLRLSECAPLFMNAFRMRGAGAVLHSHGVHALLATLLFEQAFECTHLEMIKGISDHGYHDRLQVPIIENTARECDLAESMAAAIRRYPKSHAVLVRRHGVYIWGADWIKAKTHAECYHYLFETAVRMRQLGLDASAAPMNEGSARHREAGETAALSPVAKTR